MSTETRRWDDGSTITRADAEAEGLDWFEVCLYTNPVFSEEQIDRFVADSIVQYGEEHTHKFECRTWRGQNWAGACDCGLDNQTEKG